jgi:hypothetical protein
VKVLKEGSASDVNTYETVFFRAPDLAFVPTEQVELIKKHICAPVYSCEASEKLLAVLTGIGKFLNSIEEVNRFFDNLMALVISARTPILRSAASNLVVSEYRNVPDARSRDEVDALLASWEDAFDGEDFVEEQHAISHLKGKLNEASLLLAKKSREKAI